MGMLKQLLAEDSGAKFMSELKWLVVILISIAGSLCILYAIYIGYLFATATDEGKRRTAKNRLFKVISSGLILVALAFCLNVIDLKFSTPDNGESSSGEDDPLANKEQLGNTYLYNKFDTPKLWITADESNHYITLDAQHITYQDKKIDLNLFEGIIDFNFTKAPRNSVFENVYGDDLNNYPNETSKKLDITNNGRNCTYRYRARGGYKAAIDYWTISTRGGKYWEGRITFKYNGSTCYAVCYIQVDNGSAGKDGEGKNLGKFDFGNPIAEAL